MIAASVATEAMATGLSMAAMDLDPCVSACWMPANAPAASPRRFVRLLGLNSSRWPRGIVEDRRLTDRIVPTLELDPLPMAVADQRDFRIIPGGRPGPAEDVGRSIAYGAVPVRRVRPLPPAWRNGAPGLTAGAQDHSLRRVWRRLRADPDHVADRCVHAGPTVRERSRGGQDDRTERPEEAGVGTDPRAYPGTGCAGSGGASCRFSQCTLPCTLFRLQPPRPGSYACRMSMSGEPTLRGARSRRRAQPRSREPRGR